LHVYGHLKKFPPQDCDDNRLEIPFSKNNHDQIIARLGTIKPSGTTPIARSLEECERDFPDSKARNVIVLITDGIEECSGDPCAVSKALQLKGIMLKPFVIGIGNNADYQKTFDCVGTYFNAANENSFKTILNVVISQALNNTTAQVNLLDNYGKPTETDVNMSFYDEFSGALKYNFIHTMNHRGLPDTLRLDPLSTYRMVVHTLPPVSVDSIAMTPGKHTIIPVDAPQGYLALKYDGASEYKDLQAIIRLKNSMNTLHVQDFNTTEKYIIGKYDLEILCTPRILLNGVDISQSHTTTIQIPQPGMITLLSGSSIIGAVFQEENNQLKWVLNLDASVQKQTLVLQPGNYKVVMRPKNSKSSDYTVQKTFKIVSGTSTNLNLN
jgi:Ca-activated chloride channel family protein